MSTEAKAQIEQRIAHLQGTIMHEEMGSQMNHDLVYMCRQEIIFLKGLLAV